MGADLYEYYLPSNTRFSQIDTELIKLMEKEDQYPLQILWGFPGFEQEGLDLLSGSNSVKRRDGPDALIFENERDAHEFVSKYHGIGGRIETGNLYVVHIKKEDDPRGWEYYAFGYFYPIS